MVQQTHYEEPCKSRHSIQTEPQNYLNRVCTPKLSGKLIAHRVKGKLKNRTYPLMLVSKVELPFNSPKLYAELQHRHQGMSNL